MQMNENITYLVWEHWDPKDLADAFDIEIKKGLGWPPCNYMDHEPLIVLKERTAKKMQGLIMLKDSIESCLIESVSQV